MNKVTPLDQWNIQYLQSSELQLDQRMQEIYQN